MKKFLIADMCYHQVMAESIYYPLKQIAPTYLLLNEANFSVAPDIDPSNVTILSYRSDKMNWLKRRFLRLKFVFNLLAQQKKFSFIIITAGVEYVPLLVRFVWYFAITIACIRYKNVVFVIHNVDFWKKKAKSKFFGVLFKIIARHAFSFACLSEQVLAFWENDPISKKPTLILPFLTVRDTYIGSNPIREKEYINIAIQGTVCQRRKKYEHLLFLISNLGDGQLSRFKFIFQGPPVSREDRDLLLHMEKKINIDWRDHYLSNDDMITLMNTCDLFLAPLNQDYGYGKFRESGIGFDCIKYQRGGIVQASMCSPEFRDCLLNYTDNDELLNVFRLLDFKQVNRLYKNVVNISKNYSHTYWAENLKVQLFENQNK